MNKSKRIVSAALSIAMAASMFTGVAMSASAATDPFGGVAFDENNVVLNFGSLSDIHYGLSDSYNHDKNLAKAIKTFADKVGGEDKLDAVTISGDLTNNGTVDEFKQVKKHYDEGFSSKNPTTRLVIAPGNHDAYNQTDKFFTTSNPLPGVFGEDVYKDAVKVTTDEEKQLIRGNYHTVIKGVHFITLQSLDGDTAKQDLNWLDAHLAKAQKDAPNMPIVVLSHVHPWQTCYGSWQEGAGNQRWQSKTIGAILAKYPQSVSLTGHTHFPVAVEDSIWQGGFTSINTGSMRYMSIEEGFIENPDSQEGIQGNEKISNAQLVQMDNKGVIRVTRYNLADGTDLAVQIKQPWVFPTMTSTSKAVYTEANKAKVPAPVFSDAAKKSFTFTSSVNYNAATCSVNFDAADAPNDMVMYYKVLIRDKATKTPVEDALSRTYAKFFFYSDPEKQMPKESKANIPVYALGLKSNAAYEVCVYAVDSYGNESEPLVGEFTSATYSDTPYYDFNYKSVNDFDFWPDNQVFGNDKSDTDPYVVYNKTFADRLEITAVGEDQGALSGKAMLIKTLRNTVSGETASQTIKINVANSKNDNYPSTAEEPQFISFYMDATGFKHPTASMNLEFQTQDYNPDGSKAGKTTYKIKPDSSIMVMTADGYKNVKASTDGAISFSKGFQGRFVIPVTAFTPFNSQDKNGKVDMNEVQNFSFKLSTQSFKGSQLLIDELHVLVPKTEQGSFESPKLPIGYKLGDVDQNGSITALDALKVLEHVADIKPLEGDSLKAADVTKDGKVSSLDALRILEYVAQIITEF